MFGLPRCDRDSLLHRVNDFQFETGFDDKSNRILRFISDLPESHRTQPERRVLNRLGRRNAQEPCVRAGPRTSRKERSWKSCLTIMGIRVFLNLFQSHFQLLVQGRDSFKEPSSVCALRIRIRFPVKELKGATVSNEIPQTGLTDSAASGLAYLTFIPAIIFLAIPPYNQSPSVRFHSWQSIFLSIVLVCVWVVNFILMFIPFIGWLISILLMLGLFILWLLCVINAFNGKRFVLPVLGALAAKQAGV